MQNLPTVHAGDVVRVRRSRWRIVDIRAYEGCRLVTLCGLGPTTAGLERRLISPFDVIERIEPRSRARYARPSLWRSACRALIADHAPPGALRSARRARIDLLPHQLEPALAIIRGLGSRVLLADDVGLGKTIQAGLIVSELRARGVADRVLILAPPGLRDQWANELRTRFDIEASIVDVVALRRLVSMLPVGVNPWGTLPIAIVSIDYVKRREVLPALLSCTWDVIVVDEAHGAVGGSDRHDAVATLASRAAYVVLVTATPHSGDRRAFLSLCGTGEVSADHLLVFRRTRHDVRLGAARHVHRLSVRPSVDETRMHLLLARLTRAVRGDHGEHALLALSVLHKRALSSAHSLQQSVARRLAALTSRQEDSIEQIVLPMGDPSGELSAADEAPPWSSELGLHDVRLECQLLRALSAVAAAAARNETKISALCRLLRRIDEPAVVFTEYRDTLLHLERHLSGAAVLHGGLARDERTASLEAFISGRRAVLLATDAAGEGLNLHQGCRVVVNLELPWNPMRLEQRIGRVDRIGQQRTVHAFHLIASGTGEARILDRLKARIVRAGSDIRAPDPLGADWEQAVARLVVDGIAGDERLSAEPAEGAPVGAVRVEPRLAADASAEAVRLANARRLALPTDERALGRIEGLGPSFAIARRWQTRSRLGGRLILLWRVSYEDGCGRLVASTLVPIALDARIGRAELDDALRQLDLELRRRIDLTTEGWRQEVARFHHAFATTRAARERAIAAAVAAPAPTLFQAGLFDRRSEHVQVVTEATEQDVRVEHASRLLMLERSALLAALPAELPLVLIP